MDRLTLGLIPFALLLSLVLTRVARRIGHGLNALDSAGVAGQVKAPMRRVPNTGGIAIFWAFALPFAGLLSLLTGAELDPNDWNIVPADLHEHMDGITARTPAAWALLGGAAVLHVMGLIDDRRALPAWPKLVVMLVVAGVVSWRTDTRLLTALDGWAGGAWLSIVITVAWFVVITNAFNFLDNMDGLSGGVGLVCAGALLASTLSRPEPQWFVAACLALLIGSLLGFLRFNFPLSRRGATIFQGDSGSLVVGFLLAFLSARLTYLPVENAAGLVDGGGESGRGVSGLLSSGALPALFTPLVVMAIPLYDFVSVTVIRLSQGKSPFVGDLQHFSHRLVGHGLTKRAAVLVICGCAMATSIGGVLLATASAVEAVLIAAQTACVLGVLGAYEWARTP